MRAKALLCPAGRSDSHSKAPARLFSIATPERVTFCSSGAFLLVSPKSVRRCYSVSFRIGPVNMIATDATAAGLPPWLHLLSVAVGPVLGVLLMRALDPRRRSSGSYSRSDTSDSGATSLSHTTSLSPQAPDQPQNFHRQRQSSGGSLSAFASRRNSAGSAPDLQALCQPSNPGSPTLDTGSFRQSGRSFCGALGELPELTSDRLSLSVDCPDAIREVLSMCSEEQLNHHVSAHACRSLPAASMAHCHLWLHGHGGFQHQAM